MSMTKAAIIAAARERADATRSGRWTDADLGIMLGALHWREWGHILSANKMYKTNTVTVTPDANGLILKSDLSTATKIAFRVITVKNESRFFTQIDYKDAPTPANFTYNGTYSWYENGDSIQMVPLSVDPITVVVNCRPKKASALDDGDTVDFPEGHEHVLVYGLAGEMLLKGGAETEASMDLFNFQRVLREDMLSDIRRFSTRPSLMEPMDDPADWGSN